MYALSYAQATVWAPKDHQDRHWLHLAMERVRELCPEVEATRDRWYLYDGRVVGAPPPAGRLPEGYVKPR